VQLCCFQIALLHCAQKTSWYSLTSPFGRMPGQLATIALAGTTSVPWASFSLPLWLILKRLQQASTISSAFSTSSSHEHTTADRPDSKETFRMYQELFASVAKVQQQPVRCDLDGIRILLHCRQDDLVVRPALLRCML